MQNVQKVNARLFIYFIDLCACPLFCFFHNGVCWFFPHSPLARVCLGCVHSVLVTWAVLARMKPAAALCWMDYSFTDSEQALPHLSVKQVLVFCVVKRQHDSTRHSTSAIESLSKVFVCLFLCLFADLQCFWLPSKLWISSVHLNGWFQRVESIQMSHNVHYYANIVT